MDAFTNEYLMVDEVIKILKEGNIYKAKIIQGLKESQLENEVKS